MAYRKAGENDGKYSRTPRRDHRREWQSRAQADRGPSRCADVAAIHAIDRDVAGLSPHDGRLFPIGLIFERRELRTRLRAWTRSSIWPRRIPIRTPRGKMRSASFDMTAKLGEACTKANVSRLVFASSNHVMGGYKDTPVALSDGGLPTDLPPLVGTLVKTSEGLIDFTAYAAAKLMGERVLAVKAKTEPSLPFRSALVGASPAKTARKRSAPPAPLSPAWSKPIRSASAICTGFAPCGSRTAISSGPFSPPPRRRLRMAVAGHRRERDVRESAFALGLVSRSQADRL